MLRRRADHAAHFFRTTRHLLLCIDADFRPGCHRYGDDGPAVRQAEERAVGSIGKPGTAVAVDVQTNGGRLGSNAGGQRRSDQPPSGRETIPVLAIDQTIAPLTLGGGQKMLRFGRVFLTRRGEVQPPDTNDVGVRFDRGTARR